MSKDSKNDDALNEEFQQLKADFEQLQKQNQEYLAGWQRALADYSNFQKDMDKRKKDMIEYANASAIMSILPIYNNLKLALKHVPESLQNDDFVKGVEQVKRQFQEFLKGFSIEEIKTVGEKFDPQFHEAVECEEAKGFKTGDIYEEVSAGYMMNGQVIEPAKVKVTK